MHFAGAAVAASTAEATLGFVRGAAFRAAARSIGETLLLVELLLPYGEHEGVAAIAAGQIFVGVAHGLHSF